ncbi:MAG TPA: YCF48-related protein [Ignavibacteria bacterium]|nr:YCF48-related protein [Ignavibacteria bacterium]HRJ04268.1 YCF48-related protein [Ignavibacteria bacterium]HRJ86251.1 YCF48-related protein [Ignavibacteria bacterium]
MKRIITLILFVIASNTFSQSGWELMYGGTGDTYSPYYSGIYFANDLTGYVLGNNFYKKTTDGGTSWIRTDSIGSSNHFFLNSQTGWVFGSNRLNFTSNGGTSWSIVTSPVIGSSLFFLNENTGYSCGLGGFISKTINGGINWIQLTSGVNEKLNSIHFINSNFGVCAGDWGTILTTTNSGNNWIKFTDVNLGFFTKISFIDQQTGYVCGTGNNIFRTTNAGLNWMPIYAGFNDIVVSFFFTSQSTGYMFGSFGSNFRTTNGGLSWNPHTNSSNLGKIYAVSPASANTFWCAADTGTIHKSLDEGQNWDLVLKQFITYNNLTCVHFANSQTGYIGSNSGRILRTTNSGINWQSENLNTTFNIKSILFRNSSTGYICAGDGYTHGAIFRTTNSGLNWNTVYQDTSSLNSIFFINDNTGWAVGRLAAILKTSNSGLNWITYKHQNYNSTLQDVWFTDENTGYIAGLSTLYKSTNGGINWFSLPGSVGSYRVQFTNSGTGYFSSSTSNGMVFKTMNSGTNWIGYFAGTGSGGDMCFVNEQTGWVGGTGIRGTTNGGLNWQLQISLSYPASINSIHFLNNSEGWAVGNTGTIIRTISGGIGITTISSLVPKSFNLHQNYPNPFNPVTKIRFSIPASGEISSRVISLRIYDILGKEITVLVNEELKPGIYETDWDASNFSSGIYFYSLITDNFTQTRKMVLIK